jgi:hypothetical protein
MHVRHTRTLNNFKEFIFAQMLRSSPKTSRMSKMPFPSVSRSSLIVIDSILPVFASQMEQLQQRRHQGADQGDHKEMSSILADQ